MRIIGLFQRIQNKFKILFLILSFLLNLNAFAFEIQKENSDTILVTGFEPFGQNLVNSSWEAIKNLQNARFNGKNIIVAQLPVVWDEAGKKLQNLIQTYHPAAVVSFGQSPGGAIRIESIARNTRDSILDNRSEFPKTSFIIGNGPLKLESALNVISIMEDLNALHVPAFTSNNAGAFLCNEVFYILMLDPGEFRALSIPRGFVHLPSVGSSVMLGENETYIFDAEKLEYVATAIVKNVINNLQ